MDALNDNLRLATLERIASYTVGIAVLKNTGIGTGTLITDGADRYILTAAHVLEGADVRESLFWLRPNKAMIEKAAIETTNQEVGRFTPGISIPITEKRTDPETDIALLCIDPSFVLPEGAEFYHMEKSNEFATWPEEALSDVSMLMFGFPVGNSRPIITVGDNTICFIGQASMLSKYSSEFNKEGFKKLPRPLSQDKDFLLEYTGVGSDIHPRGFSGCGIWVPAETRGPKLWRPDPLLVGVANLYFKGSNVIVSTKLPSIVTFTPKEVS
jgi:hypothetical protein